MCSDVAIVDTAAQLEANGFAVISNAITADDRARLLAITAPQECMLGKRAKRDATYAMRHLLWERPGLRDLLRATGIDQLVHRVLNCSAEPISVTYFDKNPSANWKVGAHQDLLMPVEAATSDPEFRNWTKKLGVVYVEPPLSVLETLTAARLHFDDCPASNGPLTVVPQSHLRGRLDVAEAAQWSGNDFVVVPAAAGDMLLMRPLLLHRSSAASQRADRRVLHVVYAASQPGGSVRWRRPAG